MSRFALVIAMADKLAIEHNAETELAITKYREKRSEMALMVARLTDQAEKYKKMEKRNAARYFLEEADRLLEEMQGVTITGIRRKVAESISNNENNGKRRTVRKKSSRKRAEPGRSKRSSTNN